MYKKIILSSSVLLGLVVAVPVFAVMMTGVTTGEAGNGKTVPAPEQVVNIKGGISAMPTINDRPCEFDTTDSHGNMFFKSMPCGKFIQATRMGDEDFGHRAKWYELMFILTVMMVWAVLLLLIGVLWKQLKKHKSN